MKYYTEDLEPCECGSTPRIFRTGGIKKRSRVHCPSCHTKGTQYSDKDVGDCDSLIDQWKEIDKLAVDNWNRKRNKNHETYRNVLKQFMVRSTCARVQVGAIIVRDGRPISTGWNGVPSGMKHCNEVFNATPAKEQHKEFSHQNEIHAEQNAISFAARNGISTLGTDLYTSLSPCLNCAKSIIPAGIENVYYLEKYDRSNGAEFALLSKAGVNIKRI